jgi:superfamily II RNA helicase
MCCAVLQDRERGVVWEETIIFLHDDAKMVGTLRAHVTLPLPAATQ